MARTFGDTGTRLGMRTSPDGEYLWAFQDEVGVRLVGELQLDQQDGHFCADDGSWFCACGAVVDDGSQEDWKKTWQRTEVGDCPACGRVRRTWTFHGGWSWQNTPMKRDTQ